MASQESKFVGRGGKGGGLTRRQAIKRTLASLTGGVAMSIPALAKVSAQSSTPPSTPWGPEQRAAAERILQREVDSGNVPGIAWSIGNATETLAEGGVGLRVVSPAIPVDAATRCALASVSKQFAAASIYMLRDEASSPSTRRSPPIFRLTAMQAR